MSDKPIAGSFSDRQIALSKCISENFEQKNIKQACYELRAGKTYYDLTLNEVPIHVDDGDSILIKPGHLVVIITMEEITLPNDILGRILSKGAFFSLGLSPVNTYADPGFKGKLGIVVYSFSSSYIAIPPGEKIAKLELSRLEEPVAQPYSGQHGYETKIWPIRKDLILDHKSIKKDARIGSPIDELNMRLGPEFRLLTEKVFGWERRILIGVALIMAFNFLLMGILTNKGLPDAASAWGIGILTNLTTAVLMWFFTGVRRKK